MKKLQESVNPEKEFKTILKLYKSTYIPDKDIVDFAKFYYEVQLRTYQKLFEFWNQIKLEDLKPFISPADFEKLESSLHSEAFGVHRGKEFESHKSKKKFHRGKKFFNKKPFNKNKNRDPVYRGNPFAYKKRYDTTANTDTIKKYDVPPTANTNVIKEPVVPPTASTASTVPIKKKVIIKVKRKPSISTTKENETSTEQGC